MFRFRRPTQRITCDRLTAELAAERRLSEKRLALIASQAEQIARLTVVNTRLAAVTLEHRDCLRREDWASVLELLTGAPDVPSRA